MTHDLTTPRPPLGTATLWLLRLLALSAACLSAYLAWTSLTEKPVLGCGMESTDGSSVAREEAEAAAEETSDCDSVLATSWSEMLGVPVALFGAGCYFFIFLSSWLAGARSPSIARIGIFLITSLSVAAACAAAWFISLQFLLLHQFCLYCLAIHACGVLITLILMVCLTRACIRARLDPKPVTHLQSILVPGAGTQRAGSASSSVSGFGQLVLPTFLGFLGVGGMIAAQWFLASPTNEVALASDFSGTFDLDDDDAEGYAQPIDVNQHVVHRPVGEAGAHSTTDSNAASDTVGQFAPPAELSLPTASNSDGEETSTSLVTQQNASSPAAEESTRERSGQRPPAAASSSRIVSFLRGKLRFDIYEQAYIGDPESPYVVLELFDYTCKHCRRLHEMMVRTRSRYGGRVTVVQMPVPLEMKCNHRMKRAGIGHRGACQLAKLSMVVAELNPRRFEIFHDWLMEDKDRVPGYDVALVEAYRKFGRENVRNLLQGDEHSNRIRRHVNLYANLERQWKREKSFGMPVLIAGDAVSAGGIEFDIDLYKLLERGLKIEAGR